MKNQPVFQPDVSDIDRIIKRDYPQSQFFSIKSIINRYGINEKECTRVQMDSLKLANGNVDKLVQVIEMAITDYRDVIMSAEYPNYTKSSKGDIINSRAIREDWEQLMAWYNRQ